MAGGPRLSGGGQGFETRGETTGENGAIVTIEGVGERYLTGGVVTLPVWSAQMTHVCEPPAGSEWTDSTSGPVAKFTATSAMLPFSITDVPGVYPN